MVFAAKVSLLPRLAKYPTALPLKKFVHIRNIGIIRSPIKRQHMTSRVTLPISKNKILF